MVSTKEIIDEEERLRINDSGDKYYPFLDKQWVSAEKLKEKIKGYVELRKHLGKQAKRNDLKMKIDALNDLLEDGT